MLNTTECLKTVHSLGGNDITRVLLSEHLADFKLLWFKLFVVIQTSNQSISQCSRDVLFNPLQVLLKTKKVFLIEICEYPYFYSLVLSLLFFFSFTQFASLSAGPRISSCQNVVSRGKCIEDLVWIMFLFLIALFQLPWSASSSLSSRRGVNA